MEKWQAFRVTITDTQLGVSVVAGSSSETVGEAYFDTLLSIQVLAMYINFMVRNTRSVREMQDL
jgi:hypothetical protein